MTIHIHITWACLCPSVFISCSLDYEAWTDEAWCDQLEFLFEQISTLERQGNPSKQRTVFIVDTFQWSLCSTTNRYHSFERHKSQSVNVGPLLNVLMVSTLASHSPAGRPRLAMTFVPWKGTLTVDHQPQPSTQRKPTMQRSIQCLESQPSDMYWQRGFANSKYLFIYIYIYIYVCMQIYIWLYTSTFIFTHLDTHLEWILNVFYPIVEPTNWTTKQKNKGTHMRTHPNFPEKKIWLPDFEGAGPRASPRPALERDD